MKNNENENINLMNFFTVISSYAYEGQSNELDVPYNIPSIPRWKWK